MELIEQIWEQGSIPIIVVIGVTVIYMIGLLIYLRVRKKKTTGAIEAFLQQYPDAAKVYLTEKKGTATAHVKIYSVNGEAPVEFPELNRPGAYLKPGSNTCEISYEYSEYVSRRKTLVHSTGRVKKVLQVEPNKSYLLTFNNDTAQFEFREYEV